MTTKSLRFRSGCTILAGISFTSLLKRNARRRRSSCSRLSCVLLLLFRRLCVMEPAEDTAESETPDTDDTVALLSQDSIERSSAGLEPSDCKPDLVEASAYK